MKDAKGHGSNSRGVPDQHRARIAAQNRANPLMGYFLGGDMRPEDMEAAKAALASGPKSAAAPVHDSMGTQGYYARVSSKNGSKLASYGPYPTHEDAARDALAKHPNAKGVSTSRGQHGMDIRYHTRNSLGQDKADRQY